MGSEDAAAAASPTAAFLLVVRDAARQGTALRAQDLDGVEAEQLAGVAELVLQPGPIGSREPVPESEQLGSRLRLSHHVAGLIREASEQILDLVAARLRLAGELLPALADEVALSPLVEAHVEHDHAEQGEHDEAARHAAGVAVEARAPPEQEADRVTGGGSGRWGRRKRGIPALHRVPVG
jgi:hypothetical protein